MQWNIHRMNQNVEKSNYILHNTFSYNLEMCFDVLPIGNYPAIKTEKEIKLE